MKKNRKKVRNNFFNKIFYNIEPGVFEKEILKKKYKGKSDRVALYQMFQEGWKKKGYK